MYSCRKYLSVYLYHNELLMFYSAWLCMCYNLNNKNNFYDCQISGKIHLSEYK